MFKSLREKIGTWFKKEVVEDIVEKDKKVKVEAKKKVKDEKGKAKKEKIKKADKEEKIEKKKEESKTIGKIKGKVEEEENGGAVDAEEKLAEDFEEIKEEFEPEEKEGFFGRLKKKLSAGVLTQEQFDDVFEELEMVLLENNVALEVVDKIHDSLSEDLVNISVKKSEIEKTVLESLRESVLGILKEGEDLVKMLEKRLGTYVVLFFGINGSGKTTSVAKFASMLKVRGISCVLVAADTFRAASIEQLSEHAEKVGVPIVKGSYGADPASVVFDGINYAKKNKIKVVLIDTAGRMYTHGNLMREMEKIVRVAKPDLKIFVGESITGNDGIEQARAFNESVGLDGIILTKADVDEKAGTILSVSLVTGKPIYYLGVGQGYNDLKVFRKGDVLKGLGLD